MILFSEIIWNFIEELKELNEIMCIICLFFVLLNNWICLKKKRKKFSVVLSLCEFVFFYENKF